MQMSLNVEVQLHDLNYSVCPSTIDDLVEPGEGKSQKQPLALFST